MNIKIYIKIYYIILLSYNMYNKLIINNSIGSSKNYIKQFTIVPFGFLIIIQT